MNMIYFLFVDHIGCDQRGGCAGGAAGDGITLLQRRLDGVHRVDQCILKHTNAQIE